jgi:signal transduction histidine kinase/ActR/RegA family two-component response regulator
VAGAWEQTIDTVVGIALVILVAISWVAYQSTDRLLETNRLTAETSAVIDALDQVVSDLVDAETGQRGYLLTGDQAYLAPYLTASDEIDADLQTLRTAATQSPERLERIDHLEALSIARMASIGRTIDLAKGGDPQGAVAAVAAGRGKAQMDNIRAAAAQLRAEQRQLLLDQSRAVQTNAARTTLSMLLASGFASALILISVLVVRRERGARLRAYDELDERVRLRTAELRESNESLQLEMAERQLAQEQLLDANLQLEQALDDVQQAHAVMSRQERLRSLGELASGIAHDFNNALGMIVGFSELLLADPDAMNEPDEARAKVRLIHSAATGAGAVVARLREFYRVRDDLDERQPVQVNDVIAQAISLTRPRWQDQVQAAGHTVTVTAELQDVPTIDGRAAELREALANLILNAVDAMPEGGTLTLGSRSSTSRVIVEVSDTGVGMPADVRARVFEPFFTTKGERGSGLGLAQVFRIIDRHRGDITVASAEGQGTTFTIQLPIGSGEAASGPIDDDPRLTRPLRVLLAEDEPSLRRILASYLEIDHHRVVIAPDGRQALAAFEPGRFDLLVTDRAMPELNGDRLAAEISKLAPDLPIIMLTGLGGLMRELEERPPGVTTVIPKPVTLSAFRAAIADVIGQRGGRSASASADST